jgi:hypothetical protein
MATSLLCSPWVLFPQARPSISPTAIRDYLVSNQFLHWRFSDSHRNAVYMKNSPQFVIVRDFVYTLMAPSIYCLLDNHTDFVTVRFTAR